MRTSVLIVWRICREKFASRQWSCVFRCVAELPRTFLLFRREPMKKLVLFCIVILSAFVMILPFITSASDIHCLSVELAGDANEDGGINAKDISLILKDISGYPISLNKDYSDVNRDGKANSKDVSTMLKVLSGWSTVRLGHNDVFTTVKAASCTANGSGYNECSICGDKTPELVIAAKGHTEKTNVTKQASCTAKGTKVTVCTACGITVKTEDIPATGHKLTTTNAKKATCTAAGYSGDKVCSVCKATVEKGKSIAAAGHKLTTTNAKKATCMTAGYSGDKVCSVCKATVEKGKSIPATGHKNTKIINKKDATTTSAGYTGDKVCAECGALITKGTTIPKTVERTTPSGNQKTLTYTLNTNTKKFHFPECKDAKRISAKNKKTYTGTRDDVIKMGYTPCKNCDP